MIVVGQQRKNVPGVRGVFFNGLVFSLVVIIYPLFLVGVSSSATVLDCMREVHPTWSSFKKLFLIRFHGVDGDVVIGLFIALGALGFLRIDDIFCN